MSLSFADEVTAAKRALEKSDRRRQVERELLDEEAACAQGERRLLEAEEQLLDTLVHGSIWTVPQDMTSVSLDDSSATETDPDGK